MNTFVSKLSTLFGPSGATRTPGLLNPNQARYHLRYTRIFSFCYYTTPQAKIKGFPVCGHSCGQGRFSARFHRPVKLRKRPCFRAFRPSSFRVVDEVETTPKAGALPTALHPDILTVTLCALRCPARYSRTSSALSRCKPSQTATPTKQLRYTRISHLVSIIYSINDCNYSFPVVR